ncbi:unnamed protein product [Euphydryas editha]|uniref:Uncharacterized protein n=1 Tax=Euphydryas editha TaxID=104508 RepID=A0AAU9TWF0_EUPED|nr:unnamed protein product [Euphydryas editha]
MIRRRNSFLAAKKPNIIWDLTNKDGEFRETPTSRPEDCLHSNGPLVKDIEILIFMFLHRNNHIGVNDITLPRVAGIMPAVAVKLFHLRIVKETVPFLTISGVKYDDELTADTDAEASGPAGSKISNITHAICCPFLPSLHPKSAKGPSHIHGLMLYVAIKLDEIIHRKEKDFTELEDLVTYYKAGYDSPVTPESTRLDVMRKIGLMDRGLRLKRYRIIFSALEYYRPRMKLAI